MKIDRIEFQFVERIPNTIESGMLYICIPYATAVHKCCCGCGNEVVTPLTPTDWRLIFDGDTVSLRPSIGNWSFTCQSHYWLQHNDVIWSKPMTKDAIARGRARDRLAKRRYLDGPT